MLFKAVYANDHTLNHLAPSLPSIYTCIWDEATRLQGIQGCFTLILQIFFYYSKVTNEIFKVFGGKTLFENAISLSSEWTRQTNKCDYEEGVAEILH